MKYDEYAEYQVGNGGSCDYLCLCADSGIVLQEFALHIDIDTSMCGFTETDVPQYVANLMDSETDKDHKAVVRKHCPLCRQPPSHTPDVTESILGEDCRQQLHSAQLPDSLSSSGKHLNFSARICGNIVRLTHANVDMGSDENNN
jgi:hypothetical protein